MSLPPAVFLAFACLALAVSAQPVCDIGDCEDSVLLQRDSSANTLALLGHYDESVAALLGANHLASTSDEEMNDDYDEAFATSIKGTIDCLKPKSGCSKTQVAQKVLTVLSDGLAVAGKLPGLSLIVGLGKIVLSFFDPAAKKKPGPPPLTLADIGHVMKNTFESLTEVSVTEFILPGILGIVQQLVKQLHYAVVSNDTSDWNEFHTNLPQMTSTLTNLILKTSTSWNKMVNPGGWVQTEVASGLTFSASCQKTCPDSAQAPHWTTKNCTDGLTKAKSDLGMLRQVAAKLTSVTDAMALLPCMAQAVYTKYGKKDDFFLHNIRSAVLAPIKTSLKVNKALEKMGTSCSSTMEQFAHPGPDLCPKGYAEDARPVSSEHPIPETNKGLCTGNPENLPIGTNMATLRHTDGNSKCSDTEKYGHGWQQVASIKVKCTYELLGDIHERICMHGQFGWEAWKADEWKHKVQKDWWLDACIDNAFGGGNYSAFIPGLANKKSEQMCKGIWHQMDFSRPLIGEPEIHGDWYYVCARPYACAPSACSTIFHSSAQTFGWHQ